MLFTVQRETSVLHAPSNQFARVVHLALHSEAEGVLGGELSLVFADPKRAEAVVKEGGVELSFRPSAPPRPTPEEPAPPAGRKSRRVIDEAETQED